MAVGNGYQEVQTLTFDRDFVSLAQIHAAAVQDQLYSSVHTEEGSPDEIGHGEDLVLPAALDAQCHLVLLVHCWNY